MRTISHNKPKANKKHICDAWEFICEALAKDDPYKCRGIHKGDIYTNQFNTDGGDVWTFKACSPCLKLAAEADISLTQRKRNIARELEQIDEALALLEKNPDVLRLMDLVGNIGY